MQEVSGSIRLLHQPSPLRGYGWQAPVHGLMGRHTRHRKAVGLSAEL